MRSSHRRPVSPAPPGRPGARAPGRGRPSARLDPGRPQHWHAQRLIGVLSGRRPVHVLLGHIREPAYEQLLRLAAQTPLRPPAGTRAAPALRQVGICRPADGVIEAFARVALGERVQALAFRLERAPAGRWLCTAVELAPRPAPAASPAAA